jgi:hypothetical protein
LALCKDGRSIGEVVLIDSKSDQLSQAPKAVQEKFRSLSGPIPHAVITDAAAETAFGGYTHKELSSKNFNSIFREAKRALRDSIGKTPTIPNSSDDVVPSAGSDGPKSIANAPLETWTSSKGTRIEARITKIDPSTVTLVAKDGRVYPVKLEQLSAESRKLAEKYAAR